MRYLKSLAVARALKKPQQNAEAFFVFQMNSGLEVVETLESVVFSYAAEFLFDA